VSRQLLGAGGAIAHSRAFGRDGPESHEPQARHAAHDAARASVRALNRGLLK
jgi:hypothetical protein